MRYLDELILFQAVSGTKNIKKSYYEKNGFDSDAERKFAVVLEADKSVLRWIKPPQNQMGIYYAAGQQYTPDFLVETADKKYMVEVKAKMNCVTRRFS